MAICRIIETGVAPSVYDQVREKVGVATTPPPGAQLHIATTGDDGKVTIFEVWDSREQAEEFGEKVMAARQELGLNTGSPPQMTYREVYKLLK